jgi:16S rRNA (cytidine1402-2'-O)-methyltransferase
LKEVDRISCEDTRQTQKLLNHFDIATPTLSYHEHNEQARTVELIALLLQGGRVAVVSDAGTPAFSDPGFELVRAALAAGVRVIPIPGANAALSALVASGLDTERFLYVGFLPAKPGARRTELETLASTNPDLVIVVYEAPHRILDTLTDVEAVWGDQVRVVVARELTKIHEEYLRGTASEVRLALSSRERVRGEMVLLIEAATACLPAKGIASVSQHLTQLMEAQGLDEKDALKRIARERGVSKSDVYRELQRERSRK